MSTKFCDCKQGRVPCSCKDPVGDVIAEDAASRAVPTIADRLRDQRKQDQAEAAELQSWLVGNARNVRPVAFCGLFAWALAALKAGASREATLRAQLDELVARIEDLPPASKTLVGCRCVMFGKNNPHWPCELHPAPSANAEPANKEAP